MCTACPAFFNATNATAAAIAAATPPPYAPLISLFQGLCVDSQLGVGPSTGPTMRPCIGNPSQLWPVDPLPPPPNATLAQLQASMSVYGYGSVLVRT